MYGFPVFHIPASICYFFVPDLIILKELKGSLKKRGNVKKEERMNGGKKEREKEKEKRKER